MAKPILVANWKNYPSSLDESRRILRNYSKDRSLYKKLHFFVAPPLPYLDAVAAFSGFVGLGCQDISSVPKGTHTGVVGSDILKSFGVRITILGHSERRALGENSGDVAVKVGAALASGIVPLICVGENTKDADGEHFEYIREQLKDSLSGLKKSDASKIIIAYEPVWAIGKDAVGAMEPEELSQSALFIRKILTEMFGRNIAGRIPVLYGGSVDEGNADTLAAVPGVAGFLVGRASLDAKRFKKIAEALSKKK